MVDGGAPKPRIPSGYYVDFTTLAGDYGWERVPSLWRWRYFWADIRWWRFRKTDGLTWWECMLEVFELSEGASSDGARVNIAGVRNNQRFGFRADFIDAGQH